MNCFAKTRNGKIMGTWNHGICEFHGIPYALPPVGERRFRLPEPIGVWEGCLDASKRGPIPPQGPSDLDKPMGLTLGERDEDCLTLAIATPSLEGKLPVAVWLHGGANCYGGGDAAWYDGASLSRSQNIVVVNLTYRLGALGFMCYPGITDTALSMEDQFLALTWIKENIASFGGDPEKITLFGQSAGANSIAYHLASPRTEGLFQQVVLESASLGRGHHTVEDAYEVGKAFVEALGITAQESSEVLNELQKKSVEEILKADENIPTELRKKHQIMVFKPVKTEWNTPEQTVSAMVKEAGRRKIRIMMGFTTKEMLAFIPGRDAESLANADRVQSLRYEQPGKAFADAATKAGCDVWKYSFAWKAPESVYDSCHCLELPALFGNLDAWDAPFLAGASREELEALKETMQSLWGAFFRFENLPETVWPKYESEKQLIKVIDNEKNDIVSYAEKESDR